MSEHPPVPGRFYPTAGPGFVTLDVSALVDNNTHDVLDLLMNEFFEDFNTIACADETGEHDGFAPDRLAFEELKERLVERLSTRARMTGRQAREVGTSLYRLGAHLDAEATAVEDALLAEAFAPKPRDRRAS